MNYLAHAYLSFEHPAVLIGNMISDHVKGKKKFDYPVPVQAGIMLHRLIDNFTDTHLATKEAKEIFRPSYRLYSGAIIDVLYDHFLANDASEFPGRGLAGFAQWTYDTIESQKQWLPVTFARMFPYMQSHDWLFNYRTHEGIGRSLAGVVHRAAYLTESDTAYRLFEKHYQLLAACYRQFWTDAKPFARQQFDILVDAL